MTPDGRHRGTREHALAITVPALGLAFAVFLLATSTELTGPSGWYARVLAAVLGIVALVGLVIEVVRLVRPPATAAHGALADDENLRDVVDDTLTTEDEAGREHEREAPRGGLIRVGILVASVLAMVLLANPLGFWLAMVLPVLTSLLLLGVRAWWKVALATALTVASGYVLFTVLLQVRVPEGILGFF